MDELTNIADAWDKLSELQKIRLALTVLVETEPIIKCLVIVLHVLALIIPPVLAVMHLEALLAAYVCLQIVAGIAFHWRLK